VHVKAGDLKYEKGESNMNFLNNMKMGNKIIGLVSILLVFMG